MSKKTHCKRNHEFTEENTWVDSRGAKVCRKCRSIRTAEYRAKNPQTKRGHRNAHKTHCPRGHEYTEENTYVHGNKRHCRICAANRHTQIRFKKYGVTKEWYSEKLALQENACAICRRKFTASPHIDHDHSTGVARGLLCYPCNSGLGQFLDSIESLENAISYLKSFSETITEE